MAEILSSSAKLKKFLDSTDVDAIKKHMEKRRIESEEERKKRETDRNNKASKRNNSTENNTSDKSVSVSSDDKVKKKKPSNKKYIKMGEENFVASDEVIISSENPKYKSRR